MAMSLNFSIGLSGLQAAQRAMDLIGTNVTNAASEGYHRQDLKLSPIDFGTLGTSRAGVEVVDVRRYVDTLLEQEILRQQPVLGQVDRELTTLQTIESVLGEVGAETLGTTVDRFFNSLNELAAQPNSQPLQEQVVWAADAMAVQFRSLGTFLTDLKQQVVVEADDVISQVNALASQIADLNAEIRVTTLRNGNTNTLLDRRDEAIKELGKLIEVDPNVPVDSDGVVNVLSVGTPLTIAGQQTELEVGITADNLLGISVKDAHVYTTQCDGGELGGLLALRNEIIPGIESQLNALATEIIDRINALHVEGVGTAGAFTELTGWTVESTALSEWDAGLAAGELYVRITNTDTGEVVRHEVAVDLADTIADVATALDGLKDAEGDAALAASVTGSALHIEVTDAAKYRFDFLPAPLAETDPLAWTGTAAPAASGIYTGTANDTYTLTAIGTGQVGTDTLGLEVRDEAGQLVTTAGVGAGYAPGDRLDLGSGMYVALGAGTINDGESFVIRALATSDATGLLAAAGMNTLFRGNGAMDFAVESRVLNSPARLAGSLGAQMSDNANVRRMAEVAETYLPGLGNVTPADAYRQLATGVGQSVMMRQSRLEGLEAVSRQLLARRDELGGVDVNEEAANLIVFERMFQAAAKFISAQDRALQTLADLL